MAMTDTMELHIKPAENIFEVSGQLNRIMEWASYHQNRIGYFPALYHKMTLAVQSRLGQNYFDDDQRMERLVTVFANRYLEALSAFQNQQRCSKSWQLAFEACEGNSFLVLQHLLLGMNAHINLDLSIAAATVSVKEELPSLEADFNRINDILAFLLDEVSTNLNTIWRIFGWLDRLGGNTDEALINFSMKKARKFAWRAANNLSERNTLQKNELIERMDRRVHLIGCVVKNPGWKMRLLIRLLIRYEGKVVADNIKAFM